MVSRLRPLEVTFEIDNRSYKLGNSIPITINLTAARPIDIRAGRVDLVCEEVYAETFTVTGPTIYQSSGRSAPRAQVPRTVTKRHKETYVHSDVVFLTDTHLKVGESEVYRTHLDIQEDLPPHSGSATLKWVLVVVIDIVRARDVRKQKTVKVTI